MASGQLPMWVQIFQAMLTPVVAALALLIGFLQWRTSHQRAALDLFERRMAIFDAISCIISGIVGSGSLPPKTQVPLPGRDRGSIFCSGRKFRPILTN